MAHAARDIAERRFDIIVVGGGINGTGIARDAALRGLSVLLLDKADVAAGTTSWSSRLIHGGLRYLEHGEIGLVRESLRERERLLRMAPHLVKPIPLTLPIYEHHRRGPWMIRAGMIGYDLLSFDKSLPRHTMFNRAGALLHEPGLNPHGLLAAARYYDAQVEFPERLSVENMIDAVAHGAIVRTYSRVDELVVKAGAVVGVRYFDANQEQPVIVRGTVTVNVAGPWVDQVLAGLGLDEAPPRLVGGTKGSHIVVATFPGAPSDALYIEAKKDGRPYFIIPWNGLYLIGTTDVRYEGDLDRVIPSEDEVRYLLDEANLAIPAARLERDDVLYAYAGLRPLPYVRRGAESGITRRHIIRDHAPRVEGLITIIGGKLTTFRNLSEQAVNAAGKKMGRSLPPSRTAALPLPGGVQRFGAFASALQRDRPTWLSERSATYLLRVYGIRARAVLALAHETPALRPVVSEHTGAIAAAFAFAFSEEAALTLTDAIMRRTMIGYAADAGFEALDRVAGVCRSVLGWSDERTQTELDAHLAYMMRFIPRGHTVRSSDEINEVVAGHV